MIEQDIEAMEEANLHRGAKKSAKQQDVPLDRKMMKFVHIDVRGTITHMQAHT